MKAGGEAALAALQRRIDYTFRDRGLLLTALTHASAIDGRGPPRASYQRLEFLGDRVLGLVIAEMLIEKYTAASEGELSSRLADLVRKETCADVAKALNLGDALVIGGGTRHRALQTQNVLGDVCEAVIAAIFLDGGIDQARRFVRTNWMPRMVSAAGPAPNAKVALQEWAQGRGAPIPAYVITEKRGPDHASVFLVEVSLPELAPAQGEGRTRREAEQSAATAMLVREGVWKAP